MNAAEVPGTREQVSALEARYRPFEPAAAWSGVPVDAARWLRHAEALRAAVRRADAESWERIRVGFLRAAALDSGALAELTRPAPRLTTVVLRSSLSEGAWESLVGAAGIVVECHRRALAVAADVASAGDPVDEDLIARLQDLIVESQQTYTVTVDGTDRQEVELPRRQYKPVSNFLLRTDGQVVPFAPATAVKDEMRRLTAELASDAFAALHPVGQSAYAHVALSRIHPFADGNGRLARTLACLPLLREVGLPQIILADQWPAYLQSLLQSNDGNWQGIVQFFLAVQVNSMDLARSLLATAADDHAAVPIPVPVLSHPAERSLLDLVTVHLREALGAAEPDRQVAITRGADDVDRDTVRLVIADSDGHALTDIDFSVEPGEVPGWLRLLCSDGNALDVWRADVHPAPVEIVHLRVQSWLDELLAHEHRGLPESARVRGLFVLGSPRSGTTLLGNWIGSHPAMLRLAEYGGFYIAHAVAPSYLSRLPGGGHEVFLRGLRRLAVEDAIRNARRHGCTWFCDATPWNLEIAGAIADALPDAVFVLTLRHFAGAVLSLAQFPWAGNGWADAARVWVDINQHIGQLPADRTIVVGYDVLAAEPAETVAGIREALQSAGLDPGRFDDTQFAISHAHIVGQPGSTIATLDDGQLAFRPIPSLDGDRWTPALHAEVWPVVAEMHRRLRTRFAGVYESPPRPEHVAEDEW